MLTDNDLWLIDQSTPIENELNGCTECREQRAQIQELQGASSMCTDTSAARMGRATEQWQK